MIAPAFVVIHAACLHDVPASSATSEVRDLRRKIVDMAIFELRSVRHQLAVRRALTSGLEAASCGASSMLSVDTLEQPAIESRPIVKSAVPG